MTREETIDELKKIDTLALPGGYLGKMDEALKMAIEALEFMEKYDAVWEEIKYAGEHGQEIEFHRYGRVYRIREVAT